MFELAFIGLAIYLITRKGSGPEVLSPGDVATTTGDRDPGSGSNDPTDLTNYDYRTSIDESENHAWTWKNAPAIFKAVPISPGSAERWLKLSNWWRMYKDLQVEIYALLRDADETGSERGSGPVDVSQEVKKVKAQANAIMKAIKALAAGQKSLEARYKSFLLTQYGAAQVAQFYQQRKKQIIDGIWPYQDVPVVPQSVVDLFNVTETPVDPGSGGGSGPMGSKYDREWLNQNPKGYGMPWYSKDRKRIAAAPGKRTSSSGKVYYEHRINRTDEPGVNI